MQEVSSSVVLVKQRVDGFATTEMPRGKGWARVRPYSWVYHQTAFVWVGKGTQEEIGADGKLMQRIPHGEDGLSIAPE